MIAALTAAVSIALPTGVFGAVPAAADPAGCDVPACVPGITSGVVLGAPCATTSYYVFGVTSWGRLVFCGSPRRYEPRYFRSPPMYGVKEQDSICVNFENGVAQAPDGRFLSCVSANGASRWLPGDA